MPELPELETLARALRPQLEGRRIAGTWMRHKTLYRHGSAGLRTLIGRRIQVVERIGKNILIRFDPEGLLVVNLGMTGRLAVANGGKENVASTKHRHARIRFADGDELHYYDARRFGHFYIAERCDFKTDLNIGPDPFIANVAYLRDSLLWRKAPIKSLLLDQRILSGIGNIYADEALFYAGIDPLTQGRRIDKRAATLLSKARTVLRRAIAHGGSTLRDYRRLDGTVGEFQNHHAVYGRGGDECFECGSPIKRVVLSGRSTHFCPNCQR